MISVPRIERAGPTVLVVEDDPSIRLLLTGVLQREGYAVVTASDGLTGLRMVGEHDPDLIVLDVGLPGLDGFEVTRRLRLDRRTRTVPVILLTARNGIEDMVHGLDAGADDFISKPFRRPELLARIRSAIRMRQAILGLETAQAVVATLANAVEAKDAMTERHCERLATMVVRLGETVGLASDELEALAYGALLHDIGKIGVPESILTKPGPLTEEEWIVLRRHPEIGERICRPLGLSRAFVPIIRHHHERWDGRGYPDGLRRAEIPLGARIVGLADAYDAMTHDRPYRAALSVEHALGEIRREAGAQFDPELAPLFVAAVGSVDFSADEVSTPSMAAHPSPLGRRGDAVEAASSLRGR